MIRRFRYFLLSKKGMNTVEVVVILAVVLGIALIFRKEVFTFVGKIIDSIFKSNIDWGIPTPTP